MRGVGSAQSRLGSGPRCLGRVPPPRAALIPEDEYLAGDWLEIDTPQGHSWQSSRPPPWAQSSGDSRSGALGEQHPTRPQTQQSHSAQPMGRGGPVDAGAGNLTADPAGRGTLLTGQPSVSAGHGLSWGLPCRGWGLYLS